MTISTQARNLVKRTTMAAALLGVACQAFAQAPSDVGCDIIVTATGTSSTDAAAVSTAVNGPHAVSEIVVCLDGTRGPFNFGTIDSVAISPSPTADPLLEQLRITGINGATIVGGLQPFRYVQGSTLQNLKIDNIRFVEPFFTAVSIFGGNEGAHTEISDLVIEGVKTVQFTIGSSITLREGIAVTAAFADINGEIVIKNNWIDGGTYLEEGDDAITVSAGILASGRGAAGGTNNINAEISIVGNTVINWSGVGIWLITVDDATIKKNTIIPGGFANGGADCAANGIQLANVVNSVVAANYLYKAIAYLGNGGQPACSAGIILNTGFGLTDFVSADNSFLRNQVLGYGSHAILLPNGGKQEDNVFNGSNVLGRDFDTTIYLGDGAFDNVIWAGGATVAGPNIGENILPGFSSRGGRKK